jgi:hypothetical protein
MSKWSIVPQPPTLISWDWTVPFAEREELDRIAVVPLMVDEAWLGRFDAYLAACGT